MAVALVIIYNHKYEKNIDVLESLYKSKFSNIYHLMPFYTGTKENVIPVYESSYYFEGYVAQAYRSFFNSNFDHYFFIADDLILNPIINETNYKEYFKLDNNSGFLCQLDSMPAGLWMHNHRAVVYNPFKAGIEAKSEIPTVAEAEKIINNLGVKNEQFSFKQTYFTDKNYKPKNLLFQLIAFIYDKKANQTNLKKLKYPLVRSYSDIFIVSGNVIKLFCHYCGVFAATDLWVELAIPTALALTGEKIVTEANLEFKGKVLWGDEIEKNLSAYNYNLQNLLENFPALTSYIHPVKLPRWKCSGEQTIW